MLLTNMGIEMFGMVHQAARSMVLEQCTENEWQSILTNCGLNDEHFLSAQSYSDDITFALVGEIVKKFGIDAADLLEMFGRHWLKFAESSSYSAILNMAGDDLETFLRNLDRMHAGVNSTMPEAVMPSFALTGTSPEQLQLEYKSKRAGLEPFARGILLGLMERFGQTGDIAIKTQDGGALFTINIKSKITDASEGDTHAYHTRN